MRWGGEGVGSGVKAAAAGLACPEACLQVRPLLCVRPHCVTHHPVDLLYGLAQSCGLEARGDHGGHDAVQVTTLGKVMALDDGRVGNSLSGHQDSLAAPTTAATPAQPTDKQARGRKRVWIWQHSACHLTQLDTETLQVGGQLAAAAARRHCCTTAQPPQPAGCLHAAGRSKETHISCGEVLDARAHGYRSGLLVGCVPLLWGFGNSG